jgi:hypothetical protein
MRVRDALMFLGCLGVFPRAFCIAQAPSKPYTVGGIVHDEGNAPLASAELSLMRDGSAARLFRTGDDGKFSFTEVSPGELTLSVRRLGYRTSSMTITVTPGAVPQAIDLELHEIASDIASVVVEGSKGHLAEFYGRKESNNFGKFFEQKDIEKRHAIYLSELLRNVAGASLQASGRAGNRVLLRDCQPMVWLDGMRAQGAELDDVARPSDVAGLEVYPSSAGLPPQYQDRNNRMCGAIVVWTKNQ